MAVEIHELWESRNATESADNPRASLIYVLTGTDDDTVVRSTVEATIPSDYLGLDLESYEIVPVGNQIWRVIANYGLKQPTGGSEFAFDTGGGTQHITQAKQTVARYPATAPDTEGAIGVTADGVAGADIVVPIYNFQETHYLADSLVTPAYKAIIFNLTGKVNNAPFKGFAAGEVLFLGASGSKRGNDDWQITYKFAASPNLTGLTVGSITGIAKEGWHYLDVHYADDVDSNSLIKRPDAVYVHRVYDYGDFSLLGI